MANTASFPNFYVDDSACDISGTKHFIVAAITYADEERVLNEWMKQKAKVSLPAYEEVRWNSKNLPVALRREFVPIACACTGLVVLDDRSKHHGALRLTRQVWSYCCENEAAGFRLRFDENIVTDWKELKEHLQRLYPPCVGLCQADSRYEHLLQAADMLAGAAKLAIDFGLGKRNPNEKIALTPALAEGHGLSEDEGCELGWFMFANLRYCIWGEVSTLPDRPNEPWKTTSGRGLAVHSSLPGSVIADALAALDGFYMGCIH